MTVQKYLQHWQKDGPVEQAWLWVGQHLELYVQK